MPAIISAARSQQFRWNKGGAENFKKLSWRVITSKTIPLKTKIHGVLHLLNSSMFLCIFTMALLSVPMLFVKEYFTSFKLIFDMLVFFIITSLLFFICYWYTFKNVQGGGFINFMKFTGLFFTFYTIAMGFSYQNSIAVLEGLRGKKSEFVRTPKFNIDALKDKWKDNIYISKKISKNTIIEGILTVYFLFGLYYGFQFNDFTLFPFHLMLLMGFGFVFVKSITDAK